MIVGDFMLCDNERICKKIVSFFGYLALIGQQIEGLRKHFKCDTTTKTLP